MHFDKVLNAACRRGKKLVKIVIPMKGISSLSVEGGPMYDPVSDGAFVELAALIGRPRLASDPAFATNEARNQNEDELRAMLKMKNLY